ncbi:UbiX family flavin prenyltransferase [Thioclava sp. A2]|uniref:UbiX family flavin prenyltransferase n=1 Tax=Thioclava sp. FCG-A2 TaxID=3080562 RepID=UPI00295413BF|nr:UbiX family flavin prenyltransferase [Thioclava sp. A2]MDV7269333.1 UbiX family flavin prenyltransferase [Thioclava sp. A2]
MTRVILGVSGASGAALARHCAEILGAAGLEVDLVVSPAAERTFELELGPDALRDLQARVDRVHDIRNLGATIASGSFPAVGMIVAPCSMRSLAAMSIGLDDNLLTRAASVQLKERRKLVLLTREAPLSLAHLRAMTAVTEMGGVIMPPVPAFYLKPASVEDLTRQIAARAVDALGIVPPQGAAWRG